MRFSLALILILSVAFHFSSAIDVAPGVGGDALLSLQRISTYLPSDVEEEYTPSAAAKLSLKAGQSFTCSTSSTAPSNSVPTSVHALRPADIKVVAALGDSITAGFGATATSLLNVFTEARGVSWSIGGANSLSSTVTLPNILRKFNPNIVGFSIGNGNQDSSNAKLNRAVSGAIAQDIPAQARALIAKIKADSSIDFANDWKVVTIFIGGNDACAACNGAAAQLPENFAAYLEEGLDILKAGLPRTFVNLVQLIDVTKLYEVHDGICDLLHATLCKCATVSKAAAREVISQLVTKYQNIAYDLSYNSKYEADDFAVVAQPFFLDTEIPKRANGTPDRSFFAPDCFHFAEAAHAAAAVALWNNMIEPVGFKRTAWTIGEGLECPTEESPYLFTNKNSATFLLTKILTGSTTNMPGVDKVVIPMDSSVDTESTENTKNTEDSEVKATASNSGASSSSSSSSSDSPNTGLIAGIAVPIGVAALAVIGFVSYRLKKRSEYMSL